VGGALRNVSITQQGAKWCACIQVEVNETAQALDLPPTLIVQGALHRTPRTPRTPGILNRRKAPPAMPRMGLQPGLIGPTTKTTTKTTTIPATKVACPGASPAWWAENYQRAQERRHAQVDRSG
jgi:hypothetical protein